MPNKESAERMSGHLPNLFSSYWNRMKFREEFHLISKIPCYRWYWDDEFNEVEKIVWETTKSDQSILDFGSGDNRLRNKFLGQSFSGEYKTFDLSQEYPHDFATIEEISGQFDSIFLFEVIEHMDLDTFSSTIAGLERCLKPRGKFIISTPNPACIYPMWARDMTHIQQYPQQDLWTYFRALGYSCQIFRVVFLPKKQKILDNLRFLMKRAICYVLGVDYADGSLLVAKKESKAEN